MAKVTETRVKITLTDAMSGPLRKIEGEANSTNKAVGNLAGSLKSFTAVGAQIAAGAFGFTALSDSVSKLVSAGLQFNKAMETNAIGMAGILTSMTTLNGKNMEWNQALKASQGIIKGLNEDALKTAATSEELVGTFRALLGPGLGAGMKIDEIQKLTTTGVNAVKSLGLSGPQLIQELRDLVQGGITPASSTLATALGLTDADIKAAKASSEGLFNFLMERLQGFERAAKETPKTIAGMEDQLKEGLSRAMSVAVEPVQQKYKELMQQASGVLFNSDLSINEDLAKNLQTAGEHIANMVDDFKAMADIVAPVVVPAVEALGTALGVVLDNAGKITAAFVAWKAFKFTQNFNTSHFAQYAASAQTAYQTERGAAQRAAQVVMQEENKKQTAIRQRETVEKAVTKMAEEGYVQLAAQIRSLSAKYQQLGLSAEEAGKLQYQAAKQAARGNIELSQQIITAQTQHLEAADAANKQSGKLAKLTEWAGYTGGALTAVGIVLQSVTGDTNSWAYSTGQYLTMAGMAIEGVSMMITALSKLRDAYKEVAAAKAAAGMLSIGGAAVAIGAGVGAAAAGVYALTHGISWDEAKRRYFGNPNAGKSSEPEKDKPLDNSMPDISSIQPKDFGGDTGTGKSKGASAAARQAERAAERAAQKLQKELGNVHDLQAELNRKILEDTAEASAVAAAKLDEELTKMKSKLENAAKAGVSDDEIQKAQKLMDTYAEAERRLANNDQTIKAHQQRMDMIQAEQDAHQITAQEADNLRREELTSYQDALQQILSSQQLNTEQRLQIMQEYSNAVQDMESATAADYKTAWEDALDYIRNKTYDQRATIQSGIDDMLDSFANFGQNMLTESKSIGERFDDLFKNLANSIMNTMMKVIMQGLIMKSIMSMFSMGGGTSGSIGDVKMYTDMSGWSPVSFHAKGGLADGWAVVGERGPELVNFSQPGRVYTAEQTAKALNSNGSPNNVKVIIENKSGQQVKATSASTQFNLKDMVINVVLEAVSNNDGGINNILKGALA
nr:MAG TPA: TIGR02302 family protein [Caudoviricetes sp.]